MARLAVAGSSAGGPSAVGESSSGTAEQQRLADEPSRATERPVNFAEDGLIEDGDDEPHNSRLDCSWYPDSFISHSQGFDNEESVGEPWDAIAMISTISQVYRRGIYIKMFTLDHEQWETLGQGATFHVSRSDVDFYAVSSRNNHVKERVSNKLVLKRTFGEKLASTDIRSFVGELRILDHLHSHPFIVDLRGIGWFDDLSDDLIRSPKPALLLEEADNTLDHLVGPDVSISYEDKLEILAQVASALAALHGSGVVHGDVKPANVLLFPRLITREGVLVKSYVAKLSDFGSAVFDTGFNQPLPRGTRGYTAPEVDVAVETGLDGADFETILRTDVWSFGMLSAVITCGSCSVLDEAPSPEIRVRGIFSRISRNLESSTTEPTIVKDVQALFGHSLTVEPIFRRLDHVVETLESYHSKTSRRSFEHPGKLPGNLAAHLTVSYENFKHLGGPIKDFMVGELEAVAAFRDARLPMALWELGVIHLSQFANPDSSIERGLEYIRQSAESGDPRAKALAHRLHETFKGREVHEIPHHTRIEWLQDAACAGSPLATAELRVLDAPLAEKARTIHAASCYDALIIDGIDLCDVSIPVSKRGDSALHRAAATGRVSDVEFLLTNTSIDIDSRNLDGETPLLSACRFGQLETALLLLHNGADASLINNLGENGLHFAWCFDTSSNKRIVDGLIARGASLGAKAKARYAFSALDVLPISSGTPTQRAAARRRLDLVLLFQNYENTIEPGNGNIARRMLLWALRLHDTALLEFMLEFSTRHPSCKPGLAQIVDTKWLHQGEQRSLLEAACAGWISGTHDGCDLPLRFWLACCFGKEWKRVIRSSLALFVEFLIIHDLNLERRMDDAIIWAFHESHYDAMTALLDLKFEKTSGQRSRMQNHDALKWTLDAINVSIMRPQEAHLIDLIFFDRHRGTLAQQAFLSGDRYMFRLLTRRYRANAALLAPAPVSKRRCLVGRTTILRNKMNLYSVLAYAAHRDTWFADELQRLRVLPTCPWDSLPVHSVVAPEDRNPRDILYFPPLLHAVGTHFWAYVLWLIGSCASLEEKVTAEFDVLGAIMATRSLETISFFFKECRNREGGAALLPSQYREAGGYFVFRLFYDSRDLGITITHRLGKNFLSPKETERSKSQDMECFKYLLRKYPDAANSLPRASLLGIIPRQQLSILHQAAYLSFAKPDYLQLVVKAWTKREREFPRQDLFSYFWFSPVDQLSAQEVDRLLRVGDNLNLSHICPSVFWRTTLVLYIVMTISGVGLLFLQWLLGPAESWDPSTRYGGDPESRRFGNITFDRGPKSSIVYIITLICSIIVVSAVCVELDPAVRLVFAKYNRQVKWRRLCLFPVSLAIPLGFIFLFTAKAMILIIRVKRATGSWMLIPYVF